MNDPRRQATESRSEGSLPAGPDVVDVIVVRIHDGRISLVCSQHPENCDKHGMRFKGKVMWRSAGTERFNLEFAKPGPFERSTLTYDEATRPQVAIRTGPWKYTVIDENNANNILDPEIVVDPPTGDD
jgi:hypothetical protein